MSWYTGYYGRIRKATDHYRGVYLRLAQNAKRYGWTHATWLDKRGKYIFDERYGKLPRWAQSYIEGYADAVERLLIEPNIEWRVYLDGKHMVGRDVPEGRWMDVEGEMGATFWIGSDCIWYGDEALAAKEKHATADSV